MGSTPKYILGLTIDLQNGIFGIPSSEKSITHDSAWSFDSTTKVILGGGTGAQSSNIKWGMTFVDYNYVTTWTTAGYYPGNRIVIFSCFSNRVSQVDLWGRFPMTTILNNKVPTASGDYTYFSAGSNAVPTVGNPLASSDPNPNNLYFDGQTYLTAATTTHPIYDASSAWSISFQAYIISGGEIIMIEDVTFF